MTNIFTISIFDAPLSLVSKHLGAKEAASTVIITFLISNQFPPGLVPLCSPILLITHYFGPVT